MSAEDTEQNIRAKLSSETGRIVWVELARFFAKGLVIKVSTDLDLVDVAVAIVGDDKQAVEAWMQQTLIEKVSDDDARRWNQSNTSVWALVAAPWILVQEIDEVPPDRLH